MLKHLKKLDIFGIKIELQLNGESRSTTIIGGMVCIIVVILTITATWVLGNDIFYHLQPSIVVQNQLMSQRPYLRLDKYTYPISIIMQGMEDNVPYYNEKYFSYSVNLIIVNNSDSTVKNIPYEIENCRYDHFPNLSKDQIDKAGIPRYYCIKDQNITLYGYWDETINAYLNIRLSYCVGESCAPEKEIREWFLKNSQMYTWNIYVQNSLIDSRNYMSPITKYILNKYKLVNDGSHKLYEIYLQKINVITDRGSIFETFDTETSFSYEYSELDNGPIGIDKSLLDINIYSSNNVVNFNRKYIKAQNIFANVGGIIQALLISGKIITFYFSYVNLHTKLLNNVLEFEFKHEDYITQRQKYKKLSSKQNNNNNNNNQILKLTINNRDVSINKDSKSAIITNTSNLNNFQQNYSRLSKQYENIDYKIYVDTLIREKKKRELRFNFSEILNLLLCRCCINEKLKNKKKQYDLCLKPLSKRIDLVNIVNKVEEVEKLKFVLFNKDQLALFNFMSREKIIVDNDNRIKSEFPINKLYEYINDKRNLALIALNFQDKHPEQMSHMDKNLIDLIDELLKVKDIL